MAVYIQFLPDEEATLAAGASLAAACASGLMIFLQGNLGAGKTTFSRGFLQGLGYLGRVKSPTYTLMEPYHISRQGKELTVYHFDLYRLADPEELEYLGGRDYFDGHATCLVEWPEKGADWLPPADLRIELIPENTGRRLVIQAGTERGNVVLQHLHPESS